MPALLAALWRRWWPILREQMMEGYPCKQLSRCNEEQELHGLPRWEFIASRLSLVVCIPCYNLNAEQQE